MSSIKTTQIDGDVSVGRNVAIGGKANIAGSVSIGHNLKVDGWLEAPNIKGANKGIFLTVQELREAYPVPHDGWMAGVGASTPFTAYVGKGGDWVATGGTIEVTVDMNQYTEEVEQLREDIDEVAGHVSANATAINGHTQQITDLGHQMSSTSAELLNRIQGTSSATNATTDPFKAWPGALTSWADVAVALDSLMNISGTEAGVKAAGRWRLNYSGRIVHVEMFAQSFDEGKWVQVVSGALKVTESGGGISFGLSDEFHIYWRRNFGEFAGSIGGAWCEAAADPAALTAAINEAAEAMVIKNKILSPDFSDASKWPVSSGGTFPDVNGGVVAFNGQTNARISQSVAYTAGNNVLVSLEWKSATINYAGEVTIEARLKSGATIVSVDRLQPVRSVYARDMWHRYEYKVCAADIPAAVDAVELYFTAATSAADNLSVRRPVILMSAGELEADYAGTLVTASAAKHIEGIDNGDIRLLDMPMENLMANGDFSNGVVGFTYVGFTPQLTDGGLRLEYAAGNTACALSTTTATPSARLDKYYLYVDMEAVITDDGTPAEDGYVEVNAYMASGQYVYGISDALRLYGGQRVRKIIEISMAGQPVAGQPAWPFNEERNLAPYLLFPKAGDLSPYSVAYTIHELRLFKNIGVGKGQLDTLAEIVSKHGYKSGKIPFGSYQSAYAALAGKAKALDGITEILRGKKLVTLGDSITWQATWQPHVATHTGMKWSMEETRVGLHYVDISDGSLYDLGLTYHPDDGYYYDDAGEAYYASGNIETDIVYRKVSGNGTYNTGLTHVSGSKYYTKGDKKYLIAHTSKGGQPMRPLGASYVSVYEQSFFAKLYQPDVIILTGGTNDPVSTYGTAADAPCTLSLADCADANFTDSVTVCSAVKGALQRLSEDNPEALIFLAVPVRGATSSKERRKELEQAYKAIAEEYGVGFINWNTGIGITDYNLSACFKDGVHPNDFGGWLMARAAIGALLSDGAWAKPDDTDMQLKFGKNIISQAENAGSYMFENTTLNIAIPRGLTKRISVKGGDIVSIRANDNKAIYYLLSTAIWINYATNVDANLVGGTSKYLLSANEEATVEIPQDCYLYFSVGDNEEYLPQAIALFSGERNYMTLKTAIDRNANETAGHFQTVEECIGATEDEVDALKANADTIENCLPLQGNWNCLTDTAHEDDGYVYIEKDITFYSAPYFYYDGGKGYHREEFEAGHRYKVFAKVEVDIDESEREFTINVASIGDKYVTIGCNKAVFVDLGQFDGGQYAYPTVSFRELRTKDNDQAVTTPQSAVLKLYGAYIIDAAQIDGVSHIEYILNYNKNKTVITNVAKFSSEAAHSMNADEALHSVRSDQSVASARYDTALRGQTGGIVGDSLVTYMSDSFYLIKDYLGLGKFFNVGKGGGQVNNNLASTKSGFCSIERMALMPKDIRLIILYGGANDGYLFYDGEIIEERLGSIDDEPLDVEDMFKYRVTIENVDTLDTPGRTRTFYQAYKTWLRNAHVLYPNALIVCVTQHQSFDYPWPDKSAIHLKEHWPATRKVILDVADEYGIPVCDLFGTSGVNIRNCMTRLGDDGGVFIHPFANTAEMEAELILNKILEVAPKHELPDFSITQARQNVNNQAPDYTKLCKWLVDLRSETEINVMTLAEAIASFNSHCEEKGIELKNNMYMVFYYNIYGNSRGYFLNNSANPTEEASWEEWKEETVYDMRKKDAVRPDVDFGVQTLAQAVNQFVIKANLEKWTYDNLMYMYFFSAEGHWQMYRLTTPSSPSSTSSWTFIKEGDVS